MGKKKYHFSIPASRLVVYSIVFSFLILGLTWFFHVEEEKKWDGVLHQITSLHQLSQKKTAKQAFNNVVREVYREVDPYYLQHFVESLRFLKREKEALQKLIHHPSFTGNETAEKRYSFITGLSNTFDFREGLVQVSDNIQETEVISDHAVEIDAQDLQQILAIIETKQREKPQLLITDFHCNRKNYFDGNEVFELKLKLLKREFFDDKK